MRLRKNTPIGAKTRFKSGSQVCVCDLLTSFKVSTCPHDIVISSQTSNMHQLSFILAPFLWWEICPRLLLQLLLLYLKSFLYVLPFKCGLIPEGIFTLVPSPQKCAKSLSTTFQLQVKKLRIIMGPTYKYFLRLSHLYLYSFSFVETIN